MKQSEDFGDGMKLRHGAVVTAGDDSVNIVHSLMALSADRGLQCSTGVGWKTCVLVTDRMNLLAASLVPKLFIASQSASPQLPNMIKLPPRRQRVVVTFHAPTTVTTLSLVSSRAVSRPVFVSLLPIRRAVLPVVFVGPL